MKKFHHAVYICRKIKKMLIYKTVKGLQNKINSLKSQGKTIGFAPTMGALHSGHISLIEKSNSECDITVCSIFVNPTQFNDPKDLEKYPRTEKKDAAMLRNAGCHILFLPPVKEVYPKNAVVKNTVDFGAMANVMEGAFRPGHFDGMAQVVNRLLQIVQPNRLYMGQKDFQQFSIVQEMLRQLKPDNQLVMCETMRETDGLAMSSRNVRLSPALRAKAPLIYQILSAVKNKMATEAAEEVKTWAMQQLSQTDFRPEYFDVVDGRTLQPIENSASSDYIVACVATWLGEVRLIDNMILKAP
jgi:pantoate--beta-alanine ligase